MQFYDSTNKTGIVDATLEYVGVNINDYTLKDITRNVNRYYKRAQVLIQQSDENWKWDDSNKTDLPPETTNLVDGQQDYGIGTDVRIIDRVEILTSGGDSIKLNYLPHIEGSLDTVFENDATPEYYELLGESILLYPAPNYDKTAGLKVYPRRTADLFVYTDTTKEPGFDEQFHDYLAIGAAYDYARKWKKELGGALYADLKEMERDIIRYYSLRSGKQSLTAHYESDE